MNTCVSRGFGLAILAIIAGCGARVEVLGNENTGGEGGFGSTGTNGTGVGAGSTGTTSTGGMTSTSSGGMTSTSSGGMTSTSSGGMTSTSSGGMTSTSSGGMTSTSSGGMTGSSSSGGMVCPGFGDTCTECLSVQCADRYCTCYNNPDCFKLSGCTNSCNGDAACEQQCYSTYPNGASDLYALSSCGGMVCQTECPGTKPLDTCTQCTVDTCGDALNACLAYAPCVNLYQCFNGCQQADLACQQKCYANYGDGVPKLQALVSCTKMQCPGC